MGHMQLSQKKYSERERDRARERSEGALDYHSKAQGRENIQVRGGDVCVQVG